MEIESREHLSTFNEYVISVTNQVRKLEKRKLTVAVNLRKNRQVEKELQNLRTKKKMLKKRVRDMIKKAVSIPRLHS